MLVPHYVLKLKLKLDMKKIKFILLIGACAFLVSCGADPSKEVRIPPIAIFSSRGN